MILKYNQWLKINEDYSEIADLYHFQRDEMITNVDDIFYTYNEAKVRIDKNLINLIEEKSILSLLKSNNIIKNDKLPLIGNGSFSVVYKIDNFKVLKLTADETTAKQHKYIYDNMTNAIIKNNVANVYQVGQIQFSDTRQYYQNIYYMICENVINDGGIDADDIIEVSKDFFKTLNNIKEIFENNSDFENINDDVDEDDENFIHYENETAYLKELFHEYNYGNYNIFRLNDYYFNQYVDVIDAVLETTYSIFDFIKYYLIGINKYMLDDSEKTLLNFLIAIFNNELTYFEDFYSFFKEIFKEGIVIVDIHIGQLAYGGGSRLKLYELDIVDIDLSTIKIKNIIKE